MLDNQEQKGRESIWSVSRETKGLYFIVFITLALIGGGLVTYAEVHVNKADGILDTALAAWAGVGRLVIASVAGSLIVTEVWRNGMVLAERLEEWFDKRREKQIAEGGGRGTGGEKLRRGLKSGLCGRLGTSGG